MKNKRTRLAQDSRTQPGQTQTTPIFISGKFDSPEEFFRLCQEAEHGNSSIDSGLSQKKYHSCG